MEVDYDKNIVFNLEYPTDFHAYRARKSDWDFTVNLIRGDSNLDGIINIIDVISLMNHIIYIGGHDSNLFTKYKLDLNTDGFIDVPDIISMINIILE